MAFNSRLFCYGTDGSINSYKTPRRSARNMFMLLFNAIASQNKLNIKIILLSGNNIFQLHREANKIKNMLSSPPSISTITLPPLRSTSTRVPKTNTPTHHLSTYLF
jgi:hypothetical protein